jgi:hypothetical protein
MRQIEFGPDEMKIGHYIKAEIAFYEQDYVSAAKHFEDLRASDSNNQQFFFYMSDGQAAIHLAYAYQRSEQANKASSLILEFDRYLESGKQKKANKPHYYYNMALLYALRDNETESFNYLQGAIDAGGVQVWQAKLEPIFAEMATQARFGQMMGGINARLAYMRNRLSDKRRAVLADG